VQIEITAGRGGGGGEKTGGVGGMEHGKRRFKNLLFSLRTPTIVRTEAREEGIGGEQETVHKCTPSTSGRKGG